MDKSIMLSNDEYSKLSPRQRKFYDYAMAHIDDENAAGPWGGWSRAHDALKAIGWTEKRREEGCRVYVALVRPDAVKEPSEDAVCG